MGLAVDYAAKHVVIKKETPDELIFTKWAEELQLLCVGKIILIVRGFDVYQHCNNMFRKSKGVPHALRRRIG